MQGRSDLQRFLWLVAIMAGTLSFGWAIELFGFGEIESHEMQGKAAITIPLFIIMTLFISNAFAALYMAIESVHKVQAKYSLLFTFVVAAMVAATRIYQHQVMRDYTQDYIQYLILGGALAAHFLYVRTRK